MDKNRKYKSLAAETLEDRAAPFTSPVFRDPVVIEPTEPPVIQTPAGVEEAEGPEERGMSAPTVMIVRVAPEGATG